MTDSKSTESNTGTEPPRSWLKFADELLLCWKQTSLYWLQFSRDDQKARLEHQKTATEKQYQTKYLGLDVIQVRLHWMVPGQTPISEETLSVNMETTVDQLMALVEQSSPMWKKLRHSPPATSTAATATPPYALTHVVEPRAVLLPGCKISALLGTPSSKSKDTSMYALAEIGCGSNVAPLTSSASMVELMIGLPGFWDNPKISMWPPSVRLLSSPPLLAVTVHWWLGPNVSPISEVVSMQTKATVADLQFVLERTSPFWKRVTSALAPSSSVNGMGSSLNPSSPSANENDGKAKDLKTTTTTVVPSNSRWQSFIIMQAGTSKTILLPSVLLISLLKSKTSASSRMMMYGAETPPLESRIQSVEIVIVPEALWKEGPLSPSLTLFPSLDLKQPLRDQHLTLSITWWLYKDMTPEQTPTETFSIPTDCTLSWLQQRLQAESQVWKSGISLSVAVAAESKSLLQWTSLDVVHPDLPLSVLLPSTFVASLSALSSAASESGNICVPYNPYAGGGGRGRGSDSSGGTSKLIELFIVPKGRAIKDFNFEQFRTKRGAAFRVAPSDEEVGASSTASVRRSAPPPRRNDTWARYSNNEPPGDDPLS